ncbi:MAG TPA: HDOD domain-containing protein [Bryobacteraceae bacterium]|nr:HDOD domain-containing protein [Bryobacteraceae bacterium]
MLSTARAGSPQTKREESVQVCLRRILSGDGLPPFRDHAIDLLRGILDPNSSSARLARVILKDLGLASQILRLSNSAAYNHSERRVISVTHAVTLLGWENVRTLVGALKYVEHFARQSPGLRTLMVNALLSGSHVRELAVALQYPWPEEAYITGLFRGLGEVLVARYFPKEYSEILLLVQDEKVPWSAACLRVLGFPWDELGARIAENWRLPSKVVMCLAGTDSGSMLDRCLTSLANYGQALTNSIYREGAPFHKIQLSPILDANGQSTIVSVRDLRRVVDSALADTQGTLSLLGIPSGTLLLSEQAEDARQLVHSMRVVDASALRGLDQVLQEANRSAVRGDFELSSFIGSLLEAIRSSCLDRVVFGLVNEGRTQIRGRLGSGDSIDTLLNRFEFSLDSGDGALLALQHKIDLLVDRERDDRYEESLLATCLEPSVFLLLPIVIDGQTVGCLYADCQRPVSGLSGVLAPCSRARDIITRAIQKAAAGTAVVSRLQAL